MTSRLQLPTGRLAERCAGPVLVLLLLVSPNPPARAAAAEVPARPSPLPAAAHALTLDLAECLHQALERHPRIAAGRASVAAAEDGLRALDALRMPECLAPELAVRRRQAALGVTAAAAALAQTEHEVAYGVTRTYFTVLYAREQERLARGVVERLSTTRDAAQRMLKAGAKEVTDADVNRTSVYVGLAQARRTQASQGVRRALAALREAIGLGPEACLNVPAGTLPNPDVHPELHAVVAAALARRGDLVQAGIFAEVAGLEVDAHASTTHRRVETFAAGADIHARQVVQEEHNTEYRPGGIAPEMPTLLVGPKAERVQRAKDFHGRAEALVEQSRNLIALEAEDAFLRWEEAAQQTAQARDAVDAGDKLSEGLNTDFISGLKVRIEDVVNARVLASQARSQYNEYLYRQIVALADLERVTAGGFCAGLAGPAAAPAAPAAATDKTEDK
jgi:outer membrane protein TolC